MIRFCVAFRICLLERDVLMRHQVLRIPPGHIDDMQDVSLLRVQVPLRDVSKPRRFPQVMQFLLQDLHFLQV